MRKLLCFLIIFMKLIGLQFRFPELNIKIDRPGKYALPPNLKPELYKLNLETDLFAPRFKFGGDVTITVRCIEKTTKIVLFAKKITVEMAKVTVEMVNADSSRTKMKIVNRQHDKINELVIIELEDEMLVNNSYEIFIGFENNPAKLEPPFGYNSVTYRRDSATTENSGKSKKLAINYFDSVYASQTFPCLDQMNMKAKFKITHVHEKSVKGFSTMELISSKQYRGEHEVIDVYEDSLPMSPFLVAIALTNFTSRKKTKFSKTKVLEIWADGIDDKKLQFLSKMAGHAVQFHSDRFDVPYPLKKLDILIIPYYETWSEEKYGLIVMNESFLLSPEDSSNDELKYNIALDVCQVIGQQWLGAYTTMSWWDEYWFHGALLLFNGVLCVEKALPGGEKNFFRRRVINAYTHSLRFDAEKTSVPLMQTSANKFDSVDKFISKELMEKAHQLMRLMNFFLGDKIFKKCITKYLKKFKSGTSTLNQVWGVFTNTVNSEKILPPGTGVAEIMNLWIYQSGYPLIRVKINAERTRVTFTQERFILLEKNERLEDYNACWIVPIKFITKNRPKLRNPGAPVREWLGCNPPETTVDVKLTRNEWILLKFPLGVLCRVRYDDANWISLGKSLLNDKEYEKIDEISRIRLILDMFELSKVDELKYEIVFEILMYVRHEMYYNAWNEAMEKFNEFRLYLIGTKAMKSYETYVKKILQPVFTKKEFREIADFSHKNHLQVLHKVSVVSYSCIFDVEDCRQQSKEIFEERWSKLVNTKTDLGPLRHIRKTILCEGIRHNDGTVWNLLFEQLPHTKIEHDLFLDILEALSCSKEPTILRDYLIFSISYEITTAESVVVFRSLSQNEIAYKVMRDFFLEEYDNIYRFFMNDASSFQEYMQVLFGATMQEDDLIKLNELIDSKKVKLESFSTVIKQFQELAARNVQWLQRNNEKKLSGLFLHMLLTRDFLQ